MERNDLCIKESYYLGEKFRQEAIKLKIPDILQFIHNIYYNYRLAEESRRIYADICQQMQELRQTNMQYYHSFSYKVGNLYLDGRAYAQRNIREWCSALHRTVDSIMQIINIVYDLRRAVDSVKNSVIKSTNDQNLEKLMCKGKEIIDIIEQLDNYSKHVLNIWGKEHFNPFALQKVDYYIDTNAGWVNVTDLMNENTEDRLKTVEAEILNHLIDQAHQRRYGNRKYVEIDYDPEIPSRDNTELSESFEISESDILKLTYISVKHDDGITLVTDAKMDVLSKPLEEIYLMGLYRFTAPNGTSFIKVSSFSSESISVFNGETKIGAYELQDDKKKSKYINIPQTIHFSKYKFKGC